MVQCVYLYNNFQQKNECRQWDVGGCSILAFMYCRHTYARLFCHLTPLCPSHWYSREQSLSERSAMAKTVQGRQHFNQGLHNGRFRHAERPVRARGTVRFALRNEPFGHAERTVWQAKTDGSAGARKGERKGEQAGRERQEGCCQDSVTSVNSTYSPSSSVKMRRLATYSERASKITIFSSVCDGRRCRRRPVPARCCPAVSR